MHTYLKQSKVVFIPVFEPLVYHHIINAWYCAMDGSNTKDSQILKDSQNFKDSQNPKDRAKLKGLRIVKVLGIAKIL